MNDSSSLLILHKNSNFSSSILTKGQQKQQETTNLESNTQLTETDRLNENYFSHEASLEDENVNLFKQQKQTHHHPIDQKQKQNLEFEEEKQKSFNDSLKTILTTTTTTSQFLMDLASIKSPTSMLKSTSTNYTNTKSIRLKQKLVDDDDNDDEMNNNQDYESTTKNDLDLNEESFSKLDDDSINEDVNLDESTSFLNSSSTTPTTNSLLLNMSGNKRKLNEMNMKILADTDETILQQQDFYNNTSKMQKIITDDDCNNNTTNLNINTKTNNKYSINNKLKRIQSGGSGGGGNVSSNLTSPLASPVSTSLSSPPLSSTSPNASTSKDFFNIVITNKQSLQSDVSPDFLFIDSVSENCYFFLKMTQVEILEKKTITSLVHQSDHNKFINIFTMFNKHMLKSDDAYAAASSFIDSLKPKPFICQMFVNTNSNLDQINNNSTKPTNNTMLKSRLIEKMFFIPSSITSNNNNSNEKYYSINFVIKTNKPAPLLNTTLVISNTSSPNSLLTTTNTTNNTPNFLPGSPSSNSLSSSSSNSNSNLNSSFPSYDCNMDSFKTKMTRKGLILHAETNNLRNLFANSNNSTGSVVKTNGLLCDIKNGKHVNILDYVHSNDQNHINQHINNVCQKGENTSAIYRLKVSEKYAFVQTQSRLVDPSKLLIELSQTELNENDKQIICSTHSIIKEIDTEVEMKGNASTSLMKTLISKKPPQPATTPTTSVSQTTSSQFSPIKTDKTNKLDSIKLKSQFKEDSSSSSSSSTLTTSSLSPNNTIKTEITTANSNRNESTTQPPIGTKFALTMLGITAASVTTNTANTQRTNLLDSNSSSSSSLKINNLRGESSLSSNESANLFDETPIKSETNELVMSQSQQQMNTKKHLEESDSLSPVASSFSKTISLNEASSSVASKQEDEQINIKKQKLFDTSSNSTRKSNVLLKRLLSTNPNSSTTTQRQNSKSPDQFYTMSSSSLNNRSPSLTDFANDLESIDDLKETNDLDEFDENVTNNRNEINFSSSSPMSSPTMSKEQEKELRENFLSSLANTNKQTNKLSNTTSSIGTNQFKASSVSKDDIILRTLLNTADLEPQILKLESVFDMNASFNNTKTCAIKKESCELQNQPPQQLKAIKTNKNQQQQQGQMAAFNVNSNPSLVDQFSQLEKTRKRKKITKPVTDLQQPKSLLTPTSKQASKKLAQSSLKTSNKLDFDYQQQMMFNPMMIKQEKQLPLNNKKFGKPNNLTNTTNVSQLNQLLIDDDLDDEKKLLTNDDPLLMQYKLDQALSPNSSNQTSIQSQMISQQIQQSSLQQQQQHQMQYSSYSSQQLNSHQQMQMQQPMLQDSNNNNLLMKMTSIKEEKIFNSSSLSSSTTSVSSISSLSSPVSNNLLPINPNQSTSLLSSLVSDNIPHQDYYMSNQQQQQQHMFLNLTNDLLDDFHLTSKTNDDSTASGSTTTTTNSSQLLNPTNENQFFMDTTNATNNSTSRNATYQQDLTNNEDNDDEMLNQLEQVFSIQSNQLNDFDNTDLDTTSNANFLGTSLNASSCLTSSDSLFLTTSSLNTTTTSTKNTSSTQSNQTSLIKSNSLMNKVNIKVEQQPQPTQQPPVQQQQSNKVVSTSDTTKSNNSIKDDDLTKQKRIEAISKHLKTDLIESFKSSNISSKLALLQSPKTLKNSSNLNETCFSFPSEPLNPFSNQFRNHQQMNFTQQQQQQQHMMMMQQQQAKTNNIQMNPYQMSLDDNNVPNLTIDPYTFQNHHLNQVPVPPQGPPTLGPLPPQPPPTSMQKVPNRHNMSTLVGPNSMNSLQQMINDEAALNETDLQKRNQFIPQPPPPPIQQPAPISQSNQPGSIDPAQMRKKLQEKLQRSAANSISSQTSQMPNSTASLMNSTPTAATTSQQQQTPLMNPTSSSNLMPPINIRTQQQQSSLNDPNNSVLLASPNSALANAPPQQAFNRKPTNEQAQQMFYNTNSANNPGQFKPTVTGVPTTSSPYVNQANLMNTNTLPIQKQLSVAAQVTSSPLSNNSTGQSPIQQSISPSSLVQPQQQQHLLNYSNNSNPSQQIYSNSNTAASYANDSSSASFISTQQPDQQQAYQLFNNDDSGYFTGLNDNEILLDEQMNRSSNSIRKQSTADFVKKQLGNTVNKRILQLNVKHQDNTSMQFYSNPNEMYMPGSPSSNQQQQNTNQIQPMSNLTVNTNNNLVYQQQQKQMGQIMSSPVLMLNGQQAQQPTSNSSSNDHLINNNNNFSSPYSNNMSMSPQPNLISPNTNYMNQQQQQQQQKVQFNSQYSNQIPPDYNQSNQYNKFIRQPSAQSSRLMLDQSNQQQLMNSNTNSTNNFMSSQLNDEFDLNFIQTNEQTSNSEDVEQKQLVQLIQSGANTEVTNSYGYQSLNKQQKSNFTSNNTFYRQPPPPPPPSNQYQAFSNYNQMYSTQNQMRMDQSNMYAQQTGNQSLMNFNTSSNDLNLMNDESGGNCSLLLD